MLALAVDAEVADWIDRHADWKDENGRRQVVRNGYLPERNITTGLGDVNVQQPRVRDRRPEGEKERFTSKILPSYLRKTKSIEELIPWRYLKGVSTNEFPEALQALLGPDAAGLSATMVVKLVQAAQKKWRRLNGANLRADIIQGVRFANGVRDDQAAA